MQKFTRKNVDNRTENMKKKKKLLVICGGLVIALCVFRTWNYLEKEDIRKNDEFAAKVLKLPFNNEYDVLDYSADGKFATKKLLDHVSVNSLIDVKPLEDEINLNMVGKRNIHFILSYIDKRGTEHREIATKVVDIQDNVAPEISLSSDSVSLTQYSGFSPADYITSVKDNVDGDMEYSDTGEAGFYSIENGVDINTPGTYTAKVLARDKQGNESEAAMSVVVNALPAAQPSYSNYDYGYSQPAYSNYDYSSPSYASSGFSGYNVADNTGNYQSQIDAGNIAKIGEDYFHHNDSAFMNQFWGTQVGDTVVLNGQTYTCTGIEHGYVGADQRSIYTDDGRDIYIDGSPDIITCDGDGNQRWIMHLE